MGTVNTLTLRRSSPRKWRDPWSSFVCFFVFLNFLTFIIRLEWERGVFLFTGPVYTTPEIFINGYLFSNLPVLNPDKMLKYPCLSLGGENLHKNNINYLERTSYLALWVYQICFSLYPGFVQHIKFISSWSGIKWGISRLKNAKNA